MQLLFSSFALIALVVFFVSDVSSSICTSRSCRLLSQRMYSSLNEMADPCEDFDEFACGGFRRERLFSVYDDFTGASYMGDAEERLARQIYTALISNASYTSCPRKARLIQFARKFNSQCYSWLETKDVAEDETLASFYSGIVGSYLPVIAERGRENMLETVLARLFKKSEDFRLFNLVDIDRRNPASSGNLTLKVKSLLNSISGLCENIEDIRYSQTPELFQVIKQMIFFKLNVSYSDLFDLCQATVELHEHPSALKSRFVNDECSGNIGDRNLTLNSHFNWSIFFGELADDLAFSKVTLVVPECEQFARMSLHFTRYGKTSAALFMYFSLLGFSDYLPSSEIVFSGSGYERRKLCLWATARYLEPIVLEMQKENYVPWNIDYVYKFSERIKDSFIQEIQRQAWINHKSKASIIQKIKQIQFVFGLHEETNNFRLAQLEHLTEKFDSYHQNFGELLASVASNFLFEKSRFLLDLQNETFAQHLYFTSLASVTSYKPLPLKLVAQRKGHTLFFSLGFLTSLSFHPDYPDYVNLGSLGTIISEAISSLLLPCNATDFQDACKTDEFTMRCRSLQRLVENVTDRLWGESSSGLRLTNTGMPSASINYHAANIMGLSVSFNALKQVGESVTLPGFFTNFTSEQLLFLTRAQTLCKKWHDAVSDIPHELQYMYAQSRSADDIQIALIAETNPAFSKAFNCPQK